MQRKFELQSVYIPTLSGFPFVIMMDGRQVQPVFTEDRLARNFMSDPLVRPSIEKLREEVDLPETGYGVWRVDALIEVFAVFFKNHLRVILDPVCINENRTDFQELVLRDGVLFYLDADEAANRIDPAV